MRVKTFSIATLSSGLIMWVVAGLWHELMMLAFYSQEIAAKHEGIGIILLGYLILAALMVYLYSSFAKIRNGLKEGLVFGSVIGLLWVFPHELVMAGAHAQPLGYVFKNAA